MGCGQSSTAAAAPRETTTKSNRPGRTSSRRKSALKQSSGEGNPVSVVPDTTGPPSSTHVNETTRALDIAHLMVPRRNSGSVSGKSSKNTSSNTTHSHKHKAFSITTDDDESGVQQTQSAGQQGPVYEGSGLESNGEWKELRKRLEGEGYMSPILSQNDTAFEVQLLGAPLPAARGAAADASQLSSISTMEGGNVSAQDALYCVASPHSGGTRAASAARLLGIAPRLPPVKHTGPADTSSGHGGSAADIASITFTETPLQSNAGPLEDTTNSSNPGELLSQAMTTIDSQLVVATKSQDRHCISIPYSTTSSSLASPKESMISDFARIHDPT